MMMFNPHLQRLRESVGMGEMGVTQPQQLWPNFYYYANTGVVPTPPFVPASQQSNVWSILNQLPSAVASILNVHTVANSPYGANAAVLNPNFFANQQGAGQQLTQAQIEAILRQRGGGSGASGSVTGDGIWLGDTLIRWPIIGLGVLAFWLIQMQPIRRR